MDTDSPSFHNPVQQPQPPKPTSPAKRGRPQNDTDDHVAKKFKTQPEEPAVYSESVRKKMASTGRTGQACDRCKERKMKCDADPAACQPCRQKNLRCYTTDRVSGLSRERGQSSRVESELLYLREQVAQYQRRHGPLNGDSPLTPYSAFASPSLERNPSLLPIRSEYEHKPATTPDIPSSHYVGWPSSTVELFYGPVHGTSVDILEWGTIDTSAWDCEIMRDPPHDAAHHLNFSTTSILRTMWHQQTVSEPDLPPKDETLNDANVYFMVMWGFVPVVHRPSFIALIERLYDHPETVSLAEKVQVIEMLAIISHQSAIRNIDLKDKLHRSYQFFHFALGSCRVLLQERSLPAMQALAMMLVHFRNLPQPGYTWTFGQKLLIQAIELDYHRDPDKIDLPPGEQNALAKELRKRVFHAILGVCVTTSCRTGRPTPWQFTQWDAPLPMAIKDSEISVQGVQDERSGQCDFWPCIQLAKLLPLITELSSYVQCARRSPHEYIRIVEALKTKIDAWRADWDTSLENANEDKSQPYMIVFTLLFDSWVAEFLLNLHHPSVCTLRTPDVLEKNRDICLKAARRLLSNSHTLSRKYKAVDYTWHSTVAYALAFGVTLHVHKRRVGSITQEQFGNMKNELAGWQSQMAYADLVLHTNNYLQKKFFPLVTEVQRLHESYLLPDPANGESERGLLSHPKATAKTTIKSEPSPLLGTYPSLPSGTSTAINGNTSQVVNGPQLLQQSYRASTSFGNGISMSASSYPMYSPTPAQFSPLPTSLAPLLNDPIPTESIQYRNPSTTATMAQDMSTVFQPQLYTDSSANVTWPNVAEEPFIS